MGNKRFEKERTKEKKTTMTTATLLWFGVSMGSFGVEVRIRSVDEFIRFKNNVNEGTSYSGTTVFLESDLSLAEKTFEPIGVPDSNYFNGTFDGQGHAISDLTITSSSQFIGLFGYSRGLTIRNVILDSSCSIASSYSDSDSVFVGGMIGYCKTDNGPCIIENNVNMGSVTFSGIISGNLYLGGVVGYLYYRYYDSTMKNCANYGDVTHSGTSKSSYIGGIVGLSYGSSSKRFYIYNSLSHGIIAHSGTTSSTLYLGGISGCTYYTTIENCVSSGKISVNKTRDNRIGRIVGWVSLGSHANYCYYTIDLSGYKKYGSGTPSSESNTFSYDSTTFEFDGTVSVGNYTGNSLVEALNAYLEYYILHDYSNWLLNKGENVVSFTANDETNPIKVDYQVILAPSLASEGNMSFDGWYTDKDYLTALMVSEITGETELYGRYCAVIIATLDVNGGNEFIEKEMVIGCGRVYDKLPVPTRTGHTFSGWSTEKDNRGELVTSNTKVNTTLNHVLYAHWTINKYTLTFIFGNGTEPEVRVLEFNGTIRYPAEPLRTGYSFAGWGNTITIMPGNNRTITAQWRANRYTVSFDVNGGNELGKKEATVTFDGMYGDLPVPTRTGYTFLGWFNEKNESVTKESIVKIPRNHTLHTHWLEFSPRQVEIVFRTKDMTRKEIKESIKKYTDADFEIAMIKQGVDETRVIIEFVDINRAKEFVRVVSDELERGEEGLVKRVRFIIESSSLSPVHHTLKLLFLM